MESDNSYGEWQHCGDAKAPFASSLKKLQVIVFPINVNKESNLKI